MLSEDKKIGSCDSKFSDYLKIIMLENTREKLAELSKVLTKKISVDTPPLPPKTPCPPPTKIGQQSSSETSVITLDHCYQASSSVNPSTGGSIAMRKPNMWRRFVMCRRCPWTSDHVTIDCKRKICPTCRSVDVDKYHVAHCAKEAREQKSTGFCSCKNYQRGGSRFTPY